MALKWPIMCWCAVKKLLTHSLLTAEPERVSLSPKRQFNVATWSDLWPHLASDIRDVWRLASPHRDFKWNLTDHLLMAGTHSNARAINGTHPWSPALWCRCNAFTARAVVFKLSLKNKVSLTFGKITRVLSDTRVPGYRQGTGVMGIETGTRLLGYLFRALITYVTTLLMLHVQLQVGNCAKQTGIIFLSVLACT